MRHSDFCRQFTPAGGRVLDLGAGRGQFAVEMAAAGFSVYGVEPSEAYLTEARARAEARAVSVTLVRGEGERLPFPDQYFDFVNCSEVTEHVENPTEVCREIFRSLKTGGHAYISFHNRFGLYDYHYHLWGINLLPRSLSEVLLCLFGRSKEDSSSIGRQRLLTMHYYTYTGARRLLSSLGFSVRDIREEKIRARYGRFATMLLPIYGLVLRPLYFNTFHLLAVKG